MMRRMRRRKEDSREAQFWTVTKGTPLLNQIAHTDRRESRNNQEREEEMNGEVSVLLRGTDRTF